MLLGIMAREQAMAFLHSDTDVANVTSRLAPHPRTQEEMSPLPPSASKQSSNSCPAILLTPCSKILFWQKVNQNPMWARTNFLSKDTFSLQILPPFASEWWHEAFPSPWPSSNAADRYSLFQP